MAMISLSSTNIAAQAQKKADEQVFHCTQDRIRYDADKGLISQKESVILQARLLFALDTIPKDSKYAPRPGEELTDVCGTGFYKEVHQVFPQLTQDERVLLKSFSPDLKTLIETREKDAK